MYKTMVELVYNGRDWEARHVDNVPPELSGTGGGYCLSSSGYGSTPAKALQALCDNAGAKFPPEYLTR